MIENATIHAEGLRWHVEQAGAGPAVLLIHGTGASAHSWRPLVPFLAGRFTVLAPDLPGHGGTDPAPAACRGLPGVAWLLAGLLRAMDVQPALVVGHSAGAAIAARLVFDRAVAPEALVGINAALRPLAGMSAGVFPLAARALAASGVASAYFARQARAPGTVGRLLERTGSQLSPAATAEYEALLARPAHVAAALGMMASWDLAALPIERLRLPVTLIAGEGDTMVPPDHSAWAAARIRGARLVRLPGLGHLAHEEAPARVAAPIVEAWQAAGATRACVA